MHYNASALHHSMQFIDCMSLLSYANKSANYTHSQHLHSEAPSKLYKDKKKHPVRDSNGLLAGLIQPVMREYIAKT